MTIGAAVTVLVAALAVTFGAPEHSRLLDLLTGHGWLTTNRPDQVVLANGQTGRLDFRLTVGKSGDPLAVVQSGGNALLVDQKTGVAGSIDVSSLKVVNSRALGSPGVLGTAADPSAPEQVLQGPAGDFYVVDRRTGKVKVTDPLTNQTLATTELGRGLSPSVVSQNGQLWTIRASTGAMVAVDYSHRALKTEVVHSSVVAPGNSVQLSIVDGAPAVLDKTRGVYFSAPDGVPGPAVTLPPNFAADAVLASAVTGPVVPLAASGQVVLVAHGKANVVDLNGLGGNQLGAPAAFAGKVYVPDQTDGNVVVLNDTGQQVGTPIAVTHGDAPQLTVDVQNGALFVNDPSTSTAFSVTSAGVAHQIAKNDPNVPSTLTAITNPPPPTTTTTTTTTAPVTTVPVTTVPTATVPTPVTPATASQSPSPTVAASVPAAPGSPSAQAGDKSATVSWTAPTSHGSPITGYTVTWTAGGGGSQPVAGGQTSVAVTGLKNGTAYVFSVKAANAVGTGPSSQTSPVTPTSTIPGAPSGVTAKAQSDGSILVSWTPANGEGHTISYYSVTATPSSGAALAPVKVTGTSATLTAQQGIGVGTAYTFTVSATNDKGGTSKPSGASASVTASTAPLAVSNLTGTANGKGSVQVSWTCDSACSAGSPLTSFTVTLSPAVGSPVSIPAVSGQVKYSTTVTGLANQTSYSISVVAANQAWGPGQAATASVLTEGQPTAAVSASWSGLTLTLAIAVTAHGATVTGCSVALSGPGGSPSASGGCGSLTMPVPYYHATYNGALTVTSNEFGSTPAANVSVTSGLKPLLATARQNFTCTPAKNPTCGRESGTCQTAAWTKTTCKNNVPAGTTIYAICWTTGANDVGIAGTKATSNVWVDVTGQTYPWMGELWFYPYQTVKNNLLTCG